MTKMLHVTMPDGSVWAVPAALVTHSRARYYARQDAGAVRGEIFHRIYQEEIQHALRNPAALIDWAQNNMNWSDVSEAATLVSGPPAVNFQEGWVSGEMEVVDKP